MLTFRGWLFLVVVVALLAAAGLVPPAGHRPLALVALTLLLWFLAEWFLFALRVNAARGLALKRTLHDDKGEVSNLWCGRQFEVRVSVRSPSRLRLPYALLIDRVPFGVLSSAGPTHWEGEITRARPAQLSYRIRSSATGLFRFEGLRVLLSDLQGFFHHRLHLDDGSVYRVLPRLGEVDATLATSKRFNLLPPPGVHRHRRPGSGSELLDLRDYLPGDPPRMIAWKVSARRDRLITKEFESDVPVRCTLFVDTSNSVRIGLPGQNALARIVDIAAAIAQSAARNRDPVGLALVDDASASLLRPSRTRRQLSDVLNRLADAAGLAPATGTAPVDQLLPLAYGYAQEVYPQLLHKEINSFPVWLPWLQPRPVWTIARPGVADYLYWLMPLLTGVVAGVTLALGAWIWLLLAGWLGRTPARGQPLAAVVLGLAAFALVLILLRLALLLFPGRRRAYRWRKELAALLSVRYGLAPGGLGLLLEDDAWFALHVQRFLNEHHVPVPLSLYDSRGRYLFAQPEKVEVLAQSLLRAVGKGHDNELFVLLVDLLELPDHLGPLLKAVKVTLARHHQVMVVCPWPPQVPAPAPAGKPAAEPSLTLSLEELIQEASALRFHRAFQELRGAFARMGVPVICAREQDPAGLVVDRLERMRTMRSSPRR